MMTRRAHRTPRRRGRVFLFVERTVLGFGMGVVIFFVERRLLRALRAGSIHPAPRTRGEPELATTGLAGPGEVSRGVQPGGEES